MLFYVAQCVLCVSAKQRSASFIRQGVLCQVRQSNESTSVKKHTITYWLLFQTFLYLTVLKLFSLACI